MANRTNEELPELERVKREAREERLELERAILEPRDDVQRLRRALRVARTVLVEERAHLDDADEIFEALEAQLGELEVDLRAEVHALPRVVPPSRVYTDSVSRGVAEAVMIALGPDFDPDFLETEGHEAAPFLYRLALRLARSLAKRSQGAFGDFSPPSGWMQYLESVARGTDPVPEEGEAFAQGDDPVAEAAE